MDQVDIFVFLDDVQFSKQSWQHRNRIKTSRGLIWQTVPLQRRGRTGQRIDEVEINNPNFWRKHLRAIEMNYAKAACFDAYFPLLAAVYRDGVTSSSVAPARVIKLRVFIRASL